MVKGRKKNLTPCFNDVPFPRRSITRSAATSPIGHKRSGCEGHDGNNEGERDPQR